MTVVIKNKETFDRTVSILAALDDGRMYRRGRSRFLDLASSCGLPLLNIQGVSPLGSAFGSISLHRCHFSIVLLFLATISPSVWSGSDTNPEWRIPRVSLAPFSPFDFVPLVLAIFEVHAACSLRTPANTRSSTEDHSLTKNCLLFVRSIFNRRDAIRRGSA